MSEGNGGSPEQLGQASLKEAITPKTPNSDSSSQEESRQFKGGGTGFQLGGPTESQPGLATANKQDGSLTGVAQKATQEAKEQSSSQSLDMIRVLQQEFRLTEKQLEKLNNLAKENGINLEQFSKEDLGDREKIKQVLVLLENEEMKLNDQQKQNLQKINKELQEADQPLTSKQIKTKIDEKKQEINKKIEELREKQKSGQLTKEDEEELKQNEQVLAALNEMGDQVGEISKDQLDESKIQRKQTLLEKAQTYFKYAGFGLAALLFIFAWKGLISEMGGQRGGGMMG